MKNKRELMKNYEDITDYKEAIEYSKIKRIPWKALIGVSMRKYVQTCLKSSLDQESIIRNLVLLAHKNKDKLNMPFNKAVQNIKIGVSSILAELKIYNLNIKKGVE